MEETYQQICGLKKKIRIGYVLKSADVGTLFSGRNSENSSNTHADTSEYPCTPAHTHASLRTLAHTHAHRCIPAHTSATCTPHTYPLMPLT